MLTSGKYWTLFDSLSVPSALIPQRRCSSPLGFHLPDAPVGDLNAEDSCHFYLGKIAREVKRSYWAIASAVMLMSDTSWSMARAP